MPGREHLPQLSPAPPDLPKSTTITPSLFGFANVTHASCPGPWFPGRNRHAGVRNVKFDLELCHGQAVSMRSAIPLLWSSCRPSFTLSIEAFNCACPVQFTVDPLTSSGRVATHE